MSAFWWGCVVAALMVAWREALLRRPAGAPVTVEDDDPATDPAPVMPPVRGYAMAGAVIVGGADGLAWRRSFLVPLYDWREWLRPEALQERLAEDGEARR